MLKHTQIFTFSIIYHFFLFFFNHNNIGKINNQIFIFFFLPVNCRDLNFQPPPGGHQDLHSTKQFPNCVATACSSTDLSNRSVVRWNEKGGGASVL